MEFTKRKNPGIYDGFEDKAVWAGIRAQGTEGLAYDIDLTSKAAFLRPDAEQGETRQFHVDVSYYNEVPAYLAEILGPEVYPEGEEVEGNPSEADDNPVFEEPFADETEEPVVSAVPSSVFPGEEEFTEEDDEGGEEVGGLEREIGSENPEGSEGSDEVLEVEPVPSRKRTREASSSGRSERRKRRKERKERRERKQQRDTTEIMEELASAGMADAAIQRMVADLKNCAADSYVLEHEDPLTVARRAQEKLMRVSSSSALTRYLFCFWFLALTRCFICVGCQVVVLGD